MKPLISILTLFAAIWINAENVELKNGRLLENIKLMSRTNDSITVYHSDGLEQISITQFPEAFINEHEKLKDIGESSKKSEDSLPIYSFKYAKKPIGMIKKGSKATIIKRQGNWKKVQIEGWIKENGLEEIEQVIPPTENTAKSPPKKRKLKTFDVENIVSDVVSASKTHVRVAWKGNYHYKGSGDRIIQFSAHLCDEHTVPIANSEVKELYIASGHPVSGDFYIKRTVADLIRYIYFEFGDDKERTALIPFKI